MKHPTGGSARELCCHENQWCDGWVKWYKNWWLSPKCLLSYLAHFTIFISHRSLKALLPLKEAHRIQLADTVCIICGGGSISFSYFWKHWLRLNAESFIIALWLHGSMQCGPSSHRECCGTWRRFLGAGPEGAWVPPARSIQHIGVFWLLSQKWAFPNSSVFLHEWAPFIMMQ